MTDQTSGLENTRPTSIYVSIISSNNSKSYQTLCSNAEQESHAVARKTRDAAQLFFSVLKLANKIPTSLRVAKLGKPGL